MNFPEELYYTPEHLWIRKVDELFYAGITDFAQSELSDIVYVEVETLGETLPKDKVFGTVEAVKTLSDLFMPLSGEIIDFNKDLVRKPEEINKSPYEAWIIQIKPSNPSELDTLLKADEYRKLIGM